MKLIKLNKEFFISATAIVIGGFALGFYFFDQVEAKPSPETVQEEVTSQDYIAPQEVAVEDSCQGGCGCGK